MSGISNSDIVNIVYSFQTSLQRVLDLPKPPYGTEAQRELAKTEAWNRANNAQKALDKIEELRVQVTKVRDETLELYQQLQ